MPGTGVQTGPGGQRKPAGNELRGSETKGLAGEGRTPKKKKRKEKIKGHRVDFTCFFFTY